MAVVLLAVVAFAAVAGARPATKRKFARTYGESKGSRLDACVTCHEGTTEEFNPYGEGLKAVANDFAKIEKEDADGDGVTNLDEIKALSFPGDALDKPGSPRPDSTRALAPDSTAAKPDSSGGADPDSTQKAAPEKPKNEGGAGGGKPRFPWSPGFTGFWQPLELLVVQRLG